MIQTFKQAWKIPEMKKKLIFTLIMLIVFRFGSNIPVPGVDKTLLAGMFNANNAGLFGLFDMFTGGSFSQFTIFALGIGPYITASIVLQLLTVAIPALEELAKQGEEGRKKINRITRYTAIGLALIQGVGYTFGLFRGVLTDNSVFAKIIIVLVLVAGTAFLMWLGEQIDQKGIGNGISLLIFAGIITRIPTMITNAVKYLIKGKGTTQYIIDTETGGLIPQTVYNGVPAVGVRILVGVAVVLFALAVIVGIILITEGTRKVPVQYAKRVVGRKMYGGQSSHIPMKVNQAGVIPVIFAVSLLQIPMTIAYMTGTDSGFYKFVYKYLSSSGNPGTYIYFIFNILLIIAFTYFYGQISLNPTEIADNLKNNGGFVPGIRPGKPTVEHITRIASRLTIVSAIFLAIVASIPTLISALTGSSAGFGGTSLIIAIGVALDTQRALETQLVMRNYSGFLK
ncbi:MAG: preprotein translocase subunit SecY [Clostridia bacterium]|nr:preprotein translocase subunit SecY [Clostridia bacterium]